MNQAVPLFPLNALVCPGGRIPLRIFEARYLDMVSRCLKNETGFVIVLLREGEPYSEDESPFYAYGTYCRIVDFSKTDKGLLQITVEGERRVRIGQAQQQQDGLWVGAIAPLEESGYVALPQRYDELREVLMALVQHPLIEELNLAIDYEDGRQVAWRLTELLPLDNCEKQRLLEMDDTLHRLESISEQLQAMTS